MPCYPKYRVFKKGRKELVMIGTARECADALGYPTPTHFLQTAYHKYYVEKIRKGDEDDSRTD